MQFRTLEQFLQFWAALFKRKFRHQQFNKKLEKTLVLDDPVLCTLDCNFFFLTFQLKNKCQHLSVLVNEYLRNYLFEACLFDVTLPHLFSGLSQVIR